MSCALKEREKQDKLEFTKMIKSISVGNNKNKPFGFDNFAKIVEQLQKPFETTIKGNLVTLTQDNAAIMIKSATL